MGEGGQRIAEMAMAVAPCEGDDIPLAFMLMAAHSHTSSNQIVVFIIGEKAMDGEKKSEYDRCGNDLNSWE